MWGVRQAQVLRRTKSTKTKAGIREVILLPPAIDALLEQKKYSLGSGKHVFLDAVNNAPWVDSKQLGQRWRVLFKKINNLKLPVRYRKPYNTRHTYASMLLSRGENEWWVATQMGHDGLK